MSHFVITGARCGQTIAASAPNRREIHDLVKDEKQYSLYVQALSAMSAVSQTDLISFFQIGGIHGLPYVEWNSSGPDQSTSIEPGGYCTHGSVLFPTWHRAYMILFEQVLQHHAIIIAREYTADHNAWKLAALNLRAPYWDWALHVLPPPEVISYEQVEIITPISNGRKISVVNPLFAYKFHPIDPSFNAPSSKWPTTLRHPTSADSDAASDVKQLTQTLESAGAGIRKSTYNLMTRVDMWNAFSNHTPSDGGNVTSSLEGIHDAIHIAVGGMSGEGDSAYCGNMADPAVAGFDPMFFLHHSNVDRMLSLWAAIHPEVWVDEGLVNEGTWTLPASANVDATSSLTPFWMGPDSYWDSTKLTDTVQLGYSYPEFNGLDMGDKDAVRLAISQKVNALYGPGPLPPPAPASTWATVRLALSQMVNALYGSAPAPILRTTLEWSAEIRFKKHELRRSFAVQLFLGPVPAAWRTSAAFVGAVHAFVNSAAARCANCRSRPDAAVEGFVHLDDALRRHPELRSLEPAVVLPFLRRELVWRVYTGIEVPVENLKSLEITVVATPVVQGPGDLFPIPGKPERFPDVTRGRPGGSESPATTANVESKQGGMNDP